MEPTSQQVEPSTQKLTIIYTVVVPIQKIEHVSIGWIVQFEGSTEFINFGELTPPWNVGDKIKITFVREDPNVT